MDLISRIANKLHLFIHFLMSLISFISYHNFINFFFHAFIRDTSMRTIIKAVGWFERSRESMGNWLRESYAVEKDIGTRWLAKWPREHNLEKTLKGLKYLPMKVRLYSACKMQRENWYLESQRLIVFSLQENWRLLNSSVILTLGFKKQITFKKLKIELCQEGLAIDIRSFSIIPVSLII